jgi:hypothetical protein
VARRILTTHCTDAYGSEWHTKERPLNKKVMQLSVLPETSPGEPSELHHQRRAQEKDMKEYMAALDAMSAHRCDNAFFDIEFGHNPFGIMLATPSDMMHLFKLA